MKHSDNCSKDFGTEKESCPVRGAQLRDAVSDETDTADIVSAMTLTGIL